MLATLFIVDRLNALYALAGQLPHHKFQEEFCRQVSEDFSLAYCQWWQLSSAESDEGLVAQFGVAPARDTLTFDFHDEESGGQRMVFGRQLSSFDMPAEAWQALAQGMLTAKRNALRLSANRLTSVPADTGVAWLESSGKLVRCCAAFSAHINAVLPSWKPSSLPFSLPAEPVDGLVWQGLYIRILRLDDGIRLAVHRDRRASPLTDREMEVVRCIASGCSFKEVGRRLDISSSTASTHLYKAYDKLGLRGRAALVQWYRRRESGVA